MLKYILNRYQSPNRDPSCNVLFKLLVFSISPALLSAALTSTAPDSRSAGATGGVEIQPLNLGEEEQIDGGRRREELGAKWRDREGEGVGTGLNLGVEAVGAEGIRGLGREREGEKENAAPCMVEMRSRERERSVGDSAGELGGRGWGLGE